MTQRVALVTGGSRGIGRDVAVGLAHDDVAIVGIHYGTDAAAARETASQVEAAGAAAVILPADLAHDAVGAARQLAHGFLTEVERRLGRRHVDVLVNNAGIDGAQDLDAVDEGTYRRLVEIHLTAPLFLVQALAPHMLAGGRIVNVSSAYTRIAGSTHPAYSATKGALNALTLSLAPMMGQRQITINAVMPGLVDTDMHRGWINAPGARAEASTRSVFGRIGTTADVADVVRFLASDEARWITGQVIDVSGGSGL